MAKITVESQLEDFKQILTFNLVRSIDHYFKGDPEKFITAPYQFAKLQSDFRKYGRQDKSRVQKIYKLMDIYNSFALDRVVFRTIFSHSKLGYKELIKPFKKTNAGTFHFQNEIRHTLNHYSISDDELRAIYKDKNLHNKIVDVESGYYTKRQRKIIYSYILVKKEQDWVSLKLENNPQVSTDGKIHRSYKRNKINDKNGTNIQKTNSLKEDDLKNKDNVIKNKSLKYDPRNDNSLDEISWYLNYDPTTSIMDKRIKKWESMQFANDNRELSDAEMNELISNI